MNRKNNNNNSELFLISILALPVSLALALAINTVIVTPWFIGWIPAGGVPLLTLLILSSRLSTASLSIITSLSTPTLFYSFAFQVA